MSPEGNLLREVLPWQQLRLQLPRTPDPSRGCLLPRCAIIGAMPTEASLASTFAAAIVDKDHESLRSLLTPDVDFRAMTPGHVWFPPGPEGVVDSVAEWFGEADAIVAVEYLETDSFADCQRVGYRLRVRNAEGEHLVEQQVYMRSRDGRIGWLRVLCSGYRPVGS